MLASKLPDRYEAPLDKHDLAEIGNWPGVAAVSAAVEDGRCEMFVLVLYSGRLLEFVWQGGEDWDVTVRHPTSHPLEEAVEIRDQWQEAL